MRKKITTQQYLKRLQTRKDGAKFYDYSKVIYTGAQEKIILICPRHGEFTQCSGNHLKDGNCRKCNSERSSRNQKFTTEEYLKLIRSKRKDKGLVYDYSKVEYIKSNTKIIIICPMHDEFLQEAGKHRKGSGCPKCAVLRQRNTIGEFTKKAIIVHGNFYDYSKVNYINNSTKIIIICPNHGEFLQRPNGHLSGAECRSCERDKRRIKNLEKYGVEYRFQSTQFKEEMRQLNLERYGVENIAQNKDIIYKIKASNEKTGHWYSGNKTILDDYRKMVECATNQSWRKYEDKINPNKLIRGHYDYHLDHRYSVLQGFIDKIDPEIIGHWINLELINWQENISKGKNCSITKEQLMENYSTYDK